jgi:hypothetical protein
MGQTLKLLSSKEFFDHFSRTNSKVTLYGLTMQIYLYYCSCETRSLSIESYFVCESERIEWSYQKTLVWDK